MRFRPRWIISSEIEREKVQQLQKRLGTDVPVVIDPDLAAEEKAVFKKRKKIASPVWSR